MAKATLRDVAQYAGVPASTASRALAHSHVVSDITREQGE